MYHDDENRSEISVIMPCYNTANYTGATLDSILNQSFSEYEIICIDDGSTDHTLSLLREYEKRFAGIRVYTDKNHGQGYQRNAGLNYASGKYIFFMDSDDVLTENCFERLHSYAEENKLDLLYFEADAFYETEELKRQFPQYMTLYHRNRNYTDIYDGEHLFTEFIQTGNYIVSPCLQFARRDYLMENHILFPELPCLEDNLYTLQALLLAKSAGCIRDSLYRRRLRQDSVMTRTLEKQKFTSYYMVLTELFKILEKYDDKPDVQGALHARIKNTFRNMKKDYRKLTDEQKASYFLPEDTVDLYFMFMVQQCFEIDEIKVKEKQSKIKSDLNKSYNKNSLMNEKLHKAQSELYDVKKKKSELNQLLQKSNQEKSELNEQLQQVSREKSEINTKLQQTIFEKEQMNEELEGLKSYFLVRVARKLHRKK